MFDIKISVIIPIYNVIKYLPECLNSLLSQTFTDFEIICIDDGSTDGSFELLQQYKSKDKRFTIYRQTHLGAAAARNYGITLSKGKYIQFLDADDYFEPTMLEELYTNALKFNSDMTACSSRKVDDFGNIIESKNPNSPINLYLTPLEKVFCYKDFKENIFSLLTPVPWNKLYLKSLITDNNIKFPKLKICEDVAFMHSCTACARRIVVFDKELINYRFNRPNSMATYRAKYAIDVVKASVILKNFLQKKGLYSELEQAFIEVSKNHIRWEIALCNDIEYQIFLEEFKKLMPNDRKLFNPALKKDYITVDYINKIIGNKKVMLWGASFFLQNLLKNEKKANPNILGIIDKNTASWGKMCGSYKIYPPQAIKDLMPEGILMTIWSNYETVYDILKKELRDNYPDTKLLPNIFEEEIKVSAKGFNNNSCI